MAYNTQTWANGVAGGTPVSASRLTVMETGITGAHTGVFGGSSRSTKPLLYVTKNGAQTIPDNATTQVTSWTTVKDTDSGFASNSYTVALSGYYHYAATFIYDIVNPGIYYVILAKNATQIHWGITEPFTGTEYAMNGSAIFPLTAGDVMVVQAFQVSGGTSDIIATGTGSGANSFWSLAWLAPL